MHNQLASSMLNVRPVLKQTGGEQLRKMPDVNLWPKHSHKHIHTTHTQAHNYTHSHPHEHTQMHAHMHTPISICLKRSRAMPLQLGAGLLTAHWKPFLILNTGDPYLL